MMVFRCIMSGFFALGGVGFFLNGEASTGLLLWLAAASVLPYDAVNKVICCLIVGSAVIGVLYFRSGDYFEAILGIAISVIIWIKGIRLYMEDNCISFRRKYRGGYSGGYSGSRYSSGSGYSSGSEYSGGSEYSVSSGYSSGSGYSGGSEYSVSSGYSGGSGYGGSSGYGGGCSSATNDYLERQRMQLQEDQRRHLEEDRRRTQEAFEAENRRLDAEKLSQQRYGCGANISSNWDNDIRNRLS